MQGLKLIDTHCDTAFELWNKSEKISQNSCHIDLERASSYKNYAQFFAVWANKFRSNDEAFEDFLNISNSLAQQIDLHCDKISVVKTFKDLERMWASNKAAAFLAVEDARILDGKIERLDILKARGVKYMTMMWGGQTCIGSSHDVDGGLTAFGREAVHKCFEYGIIPDVSHSNEQTTEEISRIAFEHQKPCIDGTDLPQGFNGIQDLYKIANELARLGYSNELIEKIFYRNFYEFIKKNFN